MTRTPPKPPIVHRLETRRASRPSGNDVGPMFWAAVAALVVLAAGIVILGGPV